VQIRDCGAETFLDNADIAHGDDFEEEILAAAASSTELLVLLTPWSLQSPYIWLEIGTFWGRRRRIVAVLLGIKPEELTASARMPVVLKKTDLLALNDIESYFDQLRKRVALSGV
jgi:hypothetical protein